MNAIREDERRSPTLREWTRPWVWLAVATLIWAAVTTRYETITHGEHHAADVTSGPALIRDRWTGALCVILIPGGYQSMVTGPEMKCSKGAPP